MQLTDLTPQNTWQIGTGDGSRSYEWLFFAAGVATVGPGDPGADGTESAERYYRENPSHKNWGAVLRQVKEGEWLIARSGKSRILGVGRVTARLQYCQMFEDVEGWDLQHFVCVDWYRPANEKRMIQLQRNCLSQSTLQGCNLEEVFQVIRDTEFEPSIPTRGWESIEKLSELEVEAITDALIDAGIRIQDAENIELTIRRIIRLTNWYIAHDRDVLEHGIRAFLVLPLLVALGWSEQCMKLEYGNVDVALFRSAYRKSQPPPIDTILEAKTFGNGLAFTQDQMDTYAAKFPECQRFISTNGYRYRYYERIDGKLVPKGYVNLLKLRGRNVLHPKLMSPIETLLAISNLSSTQFKALQATKTDLQKL